VDTYTTFAFWKSSFIPSILLALGIDARAIIALQMIKTATSTGDLQLDVEDMSGKALMGATASMTTAPDGQPALSGVTPANGTLRFNDLKPGVYELRARMPWEDTRELWTNHTDPIERFFNEDTGYVEYGYEASEYYVSRDHLYTHYLQFCKDRGVSVITKDSFCKQVSYRYVKPRDGEPRFSISHLGSGENRLWSYTGIRIKVDIGFEIPKGFETPVEDR
jgi:hypothetical protein